MGQHNRRRFLASVEPWHGNQIVVYNESGGAWQRRVLFDGTRAKGVEAVVNGSPVAVHAPREVILCAGAYQSPQLLMLSGIGPADDLSALGIDVRLDQPAVGGNLQDHLNAGIILFTDDPTTLAVAEVDHEGVARYRFYERGTSAPGLTAVEQRVP